MKERRLSHAFLHQADSVDSAANYLQCSGTQSLGDVDNEEIASTRPTLLMNFHLPTLLTIAASVGSTGEVSSKLNFSPHWQGSLPDMQAKYDIV